MYKKTTNLKIIISEFNSRMPEMGNQNKISIVGVGFWFLLDTPTII